MQVQGVTVTKIIEPKLLGVFESHNVYLCHGKYGEYLRHNSVNYSIPEWAKMENLKEPTVWDKLILQILSIGK
jgi:hypothetical protein